MEPNGQDTTNPGEGAAAAENAPVGSPETREGREGTPGPAEQEDAKEASEGEAEEAPVTEAVAEEAAATDETPAENGNTLAGDAIKVIDFRAKELRAIGRTSGAFSRKLIDVPGVKEALQQRGWFVERGQDPLNYQIEFGK